MKRREEYAYVLEVITPDEAQVRIPPRVRRDFPKNAVYVHAIGETHFTLLELTLKQNASVEVGEKVYIGPNVREKVEKIVRRIKYEDLSPEARELLEQLVRKIVRDNEHRFVEFFNKAGPVTIKLHSLELLKGIGKRTLKTILDERRRKPFESFEDIQRRVNVDPEELIVDRILRELRGGEDYYIFVAQPPKE